MLASARVTLWFATVIGALAAQDATAAPRFAQGTLAELRQRAKAEGRALVIDFSHDAIEPCRRQLATTWRDGSLWAWLDQHALAVRLDSEQDAAAAKEFKLAACPTIVVLGTDGAECFRVVGYVEAARLVAELTSKSPDAPTEHFERTKLADALRSDGDLDGALAHYLWLWDHGQEHNPGFHGVRLSSFANKLGSLAKVHPPARRALEQRRDALVAPMLAGTVEYQKVADLVALAKALDTPMVLRDVLEKVPAAAWRTERIAWRVLVVAAIAPLVAQRQYADVVRLVDDPQAFLAADEGDDRALQLMPERLRKLMQERLIANQAPLLEALFGVHDVRAAKVADQLLQRDGTVKTWLVVLRAAKRSGNDLACHDFAVRALQELPEDDHDKVRQFLQRK